MEGKKAESHEVRRRLLWLLLAAEIGMALAAACVLPLLFVNATVGEGGIVGALFERAQDPWTSSTGIMCLGLFLPIPILLLTLALGVGTYRWLQKSAKGENLQGKE
jgi:hypothetical protein